MTKGIFAQNRYALVCVKNRTNKSIQYQYKWDEGRKNWNLKRLSPNEKIGHFYKYEYINENRSPKIYLRFDADLSRGAYWIQYRLNKKAVPETNCNNYGEFYYFRETSGSIDINLFD